MQIISAMLADAATALAGKLYVHGGGWNMLIMRQFPAAHPSMALAALLSADDSEAPGTGEFRVQLVDGDGNDVSGVGAAGLVGIGHNPLHRAGQRTLLPIAVPFNEVRFETPGEYEFRLYWNGELLEPPVLFTVTTPPPGLQQIGQPQAPPP
jgi:hypothetical protein